MSLTNDEIAARMGTTKPTTEGVNATAPKHSSLRDEFTRFAQFLENLVPEGRAKDVMHTQLEAASMWAHKAVSQEAPVLNNIVADATASVEAAVSDVAADADKAVTEAASTVDQTVASEAAQPAQQ